MTSVNLSPVKLLSPVPRFHENPRQTAEPHAGKHFWFLLFVVINNLLTNELTEVPATGMTCRGLSSVTAADSSGDSWRAHCPHLEPIPPEQHSLTYIFILNKTKWLSDKKDRALLLKQFIDISSWCLLERWKQDEWSCCCCSWVESDMEACIF